MDSTLKSDIHNNDNGSATKQGLQTLMVTRAFLPFLLYIPSTCCEHEENRR